MSTQHERRRESFSDLRQSVFENPQMAVEAAERKFRTKIRTMSEDAVSSKSHIILLTGPSSSGKTTTANLLVSDLRALGRRAVRISLDDFYKDRDDMPLWEDGRKNFESIEGLDLDCLHECTQRLMATGHVDFPIFDFKAGVRSTTQVHPVDYDENTIVIFEGIHSLHPQLREGLADCCFGIYIHPNTNFVDNDGSVILEARDLRLTRRILRDSINRGTSPLGTLEMWKDVLRGELLYIRPNCQYADVYVNTCHNYEPFLYSAPITRLLTEIKEPGEQKENVERLIESFRPFFSIGTGLIPPHSLIQEFISKN